MFVGNARTKDARKEAFSQSKEQWLPKSEQRKSLLPGAPLQPRIKVNQMFRIQNHRKERSNKRVGEADDLSATSHPTIHELLVY